jgi:AcrR family transcriptional regulator
LPRASQIIFEPRKSPVQARSTASVSAILEATVQVLLDVGKERLTTTRVAHRAGVSVGTLYQYFPNKSALLQAVLRNHLESVAEALEAVCREERTGPLAQIVTRIVDTFLEAKMKNLKASIALYSVSSDVDGMRIAREIAARVTRAMASALANARDPVEDPQLVASLVQGAMSGVSHRILESASPEKLYPLLQKELALMMRAYINALHGAHFRK